MNDEDRAADEQFDQIDMMGGRELREELRNAVSEIDRLREENKKHYALVLELAAIRPHYETLKRKTQDADKRIEELEGALEHARELADGALVDIALNRESYAKSKVERIKYDVCEQARRKENQCTCGSFNIGGTNGLLCAKCGKPPPRAKGC